MTIPPVTLPLIAAQPGIWVADALSQQPAAWSVAHYIELDGALDAPLLAKAIVAGMSEADTLRMRFAEIDGEPRQWVDESIAFPLPECLDLRHHADPAEAALALMRDDLRQDLRRASGQLPWRHQLLRLSGTRWFWYQRYHHLLVDGFSFTAITRRITDIYRAWYQGQTPNGSPFTPFSEVVEEYQHYQASAACARDRAFWAEQLTRLPEPATLSDEPLTTREPSADLLRRHVAFDNAHIQALLARAPGVTPADIAFALLALWTGRLSGRNDFAVGVIFMRRMGSAALCATGPVLNVLPMAVHIAPAATLPELAASLAGQMKTLRRHQRYDAEQILRDAGRVTQPTPLYGAVFNFKMFDYRLDVGGINGITHQLASGPVNDMELALYQDEQGGLGLEILANARRYDADTLEQHIARLLLLLAQFASEPQLACHAAEMVLPHEAQRIARINDTGIMLPADTLTAAIVRQALKTPDAPALADEHNQFSYREMRQQVHALAVRLQERGVKPGDIVAVALPRSVFLSLALQAIVELGAAWLPLDTGYPDDRLQMMLEDAQPRLTLTSAGLEARFAALTAQPLLIYDAPLAASDAPGLDLSRPEQTAYVIFTSGSTGRPKGVMVGQAAIVNRLWWMQDHYPLTADDVVLQKTPCSFDVSVWEFFWPLMVGARLVMAPPDAHRDPQALQTLFARWRVTTTHFVPSMLAAFVGALTRPQAIDCCASLRQVFCSGEALPTDLCRQWERLTGVALHNLYGPTEAAVDVSWYPAWGEALAAVKGNSVPIGFPVWNTGLRVLDGAMRPVPPGVAGDLYLTGVQLAQGYLGRADLTASRFIADPFAPGERMYRTGDVARYLPDGAVEYLGRSDFQLKLRGQRIELGDIDSALMSLADVAQAVTHACVVNQATTREGDARQLVGYVVSASGLPLDTAALRQQLAARLPAHMVPVMVIQLSAMPLSANGKLDRKALPLPEPADAATGRAPQSDLEITIADAFSRLLDCEIAHIDADFFALGGHSLLAMRLAADLRDSLGAEVTVGQVMEASTVGKLAARLSAPDQQAQDAGFGAILPLREGSGPRLFCFHPASGFAWQFSVLQRYVGPEWAITGIQSPRPDGPMATARDFNDLCEQQLAALRRVQPVGPYYLLGYSLGGTLAQNLAARLEAAGEQVAWLGLLDTWPPETQNWAQKGDQPDPEVLAEIERERDAFITAQRGQGSERLFSTIEGNYADAIRLLTSAYTLPYSGPTTLFVAERTVPAGMTAAEAWAPWLKTVRIHSLDCAHVEVVSPRMFEETGPEIVAALKEG